MVETWRVLPAQIHVVPYAPSALKSGSEEKFVSARRRNQHRGTRALPGAHARCEFLPVVRVAHFPAERRNAISQFVAFFPIFLTPRVLAVFCELRDFRWEHDFVFSFEIQNVVDALPPI